MNQEIKQRWLAALRSGEYQQAHGRLRNGDSFCCLGVLCDLHSKTTGNAWGDDDRYFSVDGALPPEVQEWSGLTDSNPDMPAPPNFIGELTIAEYNDGRLGRMCLRPHTFVEIAALIEEHL